MFKGSVNTVAQCQPNESGPYWFAEKMALDQETSASDQLLTGLTVSPYIFAFSLSSEESLRFSSLRDSLCSFAIL